MTIWKRIIFGFISVIVVMIAVDSNALLNNIQIINNVNHLEHSKRIELTQSNKVAYLLQRIKSNLRELFLELEEHDRAQEIDIAKKEVESNIPPLISAIETLRQATQTGYSFSEEEEEEDRINEVEELALIDTINTLANRFVSGVHEILRLQDQGSFDWAKDYFEHEVEPVSRNIQDHISVIVDDAEHEVSWAISQLNLKVDKAITLGIYLTILSILLSMAIGLYISKSISRPLYKLIYGTKQIGKGNLETTVDLETKGEFQLLATSFNNMTKELKVRMEAINKLNADLEELNQTKDKYFSIIAHDLKNPFNAIIGLTDLLDENYFDFDEEQRRQIIRELNISSKVIYDLLENLLNWARAQNGTINLNPKTLDLNKIVRESINSYKGNAEHKHIKLVNRTPKNLDVYADEFTITVVINNVLNNAIKFTPDKGLVSITATKESGQVELCIKDTGIGMPQETIDNLFQSKKIESTFGTRNEKGTGLGLILIKDFIEKNNGSLNILSSRGKGTELKILLPSAQKAT